MKVTIDLENLESIVQTTLEQNSGEAIHKALESVVQKEVDRVLESDVGNSINTIVESYIREYLDTAKIQVGNSWNGEGIKEFTVKEYLKTQVAEIFENKVFSVKEKDRWGDMKTEKVTFQEFIEKHFDVEKYAKTYLEKIAREVKKEVDCKLKSMFDDAMRHTLADNIFTIVSSSDTYQKVQNSLKLLGE